VRLLALVAQGEVLQAREISMGLLQGPASMVWRHGKSADSKSEIFDSFSRQKHPVCASSAVRLTGPDKLPGPVIGEQRKQMFLWRRGTMWVEK
jgi:hypothetical protein